MPFDFGSVAVDTNVIIYALDSDATDPKAETARSIFRRAARFPIRIPLQAVAESFSVLTRRFRLSGSAAIDALKPFVGLASIAETAESTLAALTLCAEHNIVFWDAMIVCAAALGGCGVLLTEDVQDGRRFEPPDTARRIQIINPFDRSNVGVLEAIGVFDESLR